MVPSEELELKIFHFAESAGKARWRPGDIGTLSNAVQFPEDAVIVDALHDLHAHAFMEFRQWSYQLNDWVPYAGANRDYFYRGFEMRVSFSGRKYFERLEAQTAEPGLSVTTPERRPKEASGKISNLQPKMDSSLQSILTSAPRNPRAFISHSSHDRSFVDKFAGDLWAVGVAAWYSRWEIKPGDSIPAKIDEGIEECEFFIIVLSKNSIHAPWVQTKLQAAIARKMSGKVRKIIPITIDDSNDFPPIIGSLCREDFSDQPYESALKRVLDSIFDVDVRPVLGIGTAEQKDEQSI